MAHERVETTRCSIRKASVVVQDAAVAHETEQASYWYRYIDRGCGSRPSDPTYLSQPIRRLTACKDGPAHGRTIETAS